MRVFHWLNTPLAFAIVLILVLIVDGLLGYRFQILLPKSSRSDSSSTASQIAANETALSTPSTRPNQVAATGGGTTKEAPPATTTTATTPSSAGSPKVHSVTLSVKGATSWLLVKADGQTLLAQNAPPGFSRSFQFKGVFEVQAGNASAVSVGVDGRDLGRLSQSVEAGTWRVKA